MVKEIKQNSDIDNESQSEQDLFKIFMGNNSNQFENDIIKSRRLFINAKVSITILFIYRKAKMLYSTPLN